MCICVSLKHSFVYAVAFRWKLRQWPLDVRWDLNRAVSVGNLGQVALFHCAAIRSAVVPGYACSRADTEQIPQISRAAAASWDNIHQVLMPHSHMVRGHEPYPAITLQTQPV